MKKTNRIAALMLCGAMAFSCATPAFAATGAQKDENVFIVLNSDGSVKEQTVSDWLHSDSGFHDFKDVSHLTNITNLKSDAMPQQKGADLVWNSDEKDLYYQGTTQQTPPISAEITYTLDGATIAADQLTGKSGHFVLHIALTNHEKHAVTVEGKSYSVATPFATVIGTSLPAGTYTNIKAEHGTVQTDSSNQIVGFVCLPGVKETLGGLLTGELSALNDYLFDEVTVEADVTNCTVPTVMLAYATDAEKLSAQNGLSELKDLGGSLAKLTDAVKQLQEGAQAVFTGASKLDVGVGTLKGGVDRLANGAVDLNGGAQKLKTGAEQINTGAQKLTAGAQSVNSLLTQVCQNNTTLNAGANQIFTTLLSSASAQLSAALGQTIALSPENFNDVLNGLLAGLGEEAVYAQVRAGVEAQVKTDENRTAAQQQITLITAGAIILQQKATQEGVSLSDADAQQQAIAWTAKEGGVAEIQAAIAASSDLQAALVGLQSTIAEQAEAQLDAKVAETMEIDSVKQTLAAAIAKASAGAQTILCVQQQLNQVKDFVNGVAAYTSSVARIQAEGAAQVYAGAQSLQSGAQELTAGANTLYEGTKTLRTGTEDLQKGTNDLMTGTAQLKDGSKQLADGTSELKKEADAKLSGDETLTNLTTIKTLLDEMKAATQNYKSYTGTPTGVSTSVKFVMKTQAPAKPEVESTKAPVHAEKSTGFFERIKNLFA